MPIKSHCQHGFYKPMDYFTLHVDHGGILPYRPSEIDIQKWLELPSSAQEVIIFTPCILKLVDQLLLQVLCQQAMLLKIDSIAAENCLNDAQGKATICGMKETRKLANSIVKWHAGRWSTRFICWVFAGYLLIAGILRLKTSNKRVKRRFVSWLSFAGHLLQCEYSSSSDIK